MPATNPNRTSHAALVNFSSLSGLVLLDTLDYPATLSPNTTTWVWNGTTWSQNTGTQPTARSGYTASSDGTNIVLFGGHSYLNYNLGDTWTFNGTNWTQATPATSPSARDGALSTY